MRLKTSLLVLLIVVSATYPVVSQGLKVMGFGGYTIQDKVYGYSGEMIIRDGAHYGAMLSYEKSSQLSVDLTYSRQQTTFNVKDFYNNNSGNYAGSVNYIMLGASHSPDFTAKVAPYGGAMLGAAIFAPTEKYSEQWRFAVGAKLGAIIHLNEKFGLVLQTQLMVPVQGVGFGVGCGGGGCGSGATTTSTATQLGFTGGLEIKLNK